MQYMREKIIIGFKLAICLVVIKKLEKGKLQKSVGHKTTDLTWYHRIWKQGCQAKQYVLEGCI